MKLRTRLGFWAMIGSRPTSKPRRGGGLFPWGDVGTESLRSIGQARINGTDPIDPMLGEICRVIFRANVVLCVKRWIDPLKIRTKQQFLNNLSRCNICFRDLVAFSN